MKIPMCTFFLNNQETTLQKYENLNYNFSRYKSWSAYIIGPIFICAKENDIGFQPEIILLFILLRLSQREKGFHHLQP